MFNFDDKKFFGGDPCGHPGHFPHEKPRYTMTEEVEHTAAAMRETIDRLLRFEERCKADFDGLMKNVTSDNVIFKTTMREAWATFIQEVKNEINVFEGNVDATVSLFQKDTESNYAKLSEDVHAQIAANLADFNAKVTEFETAYVQAFDAFKDAINTRIENYNDNHSQAFADYQVNVGIRLDGFEAEIREAFDAFQTALNETVNNFKTTWANAIAARLDNQDAKISDAEMYMKTNLSASMESLVDELIDEGVIDTITREAYGELVNDIYGAGFSNETIEAIKSDKTVDVIAITVPNKVYDFKGATINTLNVETTGATIKNAIVKNCSVLAGSRNCSFDNVRFENAVQCVNFSVNTWAFNFRGCSFIGEGETVAMNAGANTNTTLVLTNCYFYKCAKLIYATGGFVCSVVGGWADEAKQIVHVTSGNCDIVINGFDFEAIENVFKADAYTFSNIVVNGIVGVVSSVVDYTDGCINLVYDATINNSVKLFSDNCPATHYCNVPTADGSKYRFNGSMTEKVITAYVPPLSSACMLDACHVNKIVFDNASVEVYTRYGKYTSGATLNSVTPVFVRNIAEVGNNVQLTVTSYNYL